MNSAAKIPAQFLTFLSSHYCSFLSQLPVWIHNTKSDLALYLFYLKKVNKLCFVPLYLPKWLLKDFHFLLQWIINKIAMTRRAKKYFLMRDLQIKSHEVFRLKRKFYYIPDILFYNDYDIWIYLDVVPHPALYLLFSNLKINFKLKGQEGRDHRENNR